MPTPTYTPLANVTLASTASSVTFSNIPATYRDLIVVVAGTTSANSIDINLTLNSDTTDGNYARVQMSGTSSNTAVSGTDNTRRITSWAFWRTDEVANSIVQIMDYSATDKHKTLLTRSNRAGSGLDALATRWANTAAITSVAVSTSSSTFASGCTFSLYGVIA
jgi:phosphoserine aminotransferase